MTGKQGRTTVPIFPLNTVHFPGMPLNLHIFETRYMALVRDLESSANCFCVALIREGVEVGGPAIPFDVACIVRVVQLRRLDEGGYHLFAIVTERVRITLIDSQTKPYLRGDVVSWPDVGTAPRKDVIAQLTKLYARYYACVAAFTGRDSGVQELPSEPEAMSFAIAASLQCTPSDRQRLLEISGCADRLEAELEMLKAELPLIRALEVGPGPDVIAGGHFSLN